jgi:hypothetical protein
VIKRIKKDFKDKNDKKEGKPRLRNEAPIPIQTKSINFGFTFISLYPFLSL